jgi:lipoyl(octanoyl) transferase
VPRPDAFIALDPPADAPTNFGRDEALHARAARTGAVAMRVYGWSAPTVSFGRHERARDRYDPAVLATLGLTPTRRLTGGRALVHTAEITYAIAGPIDPAASLRQTVEAINAVLHDALHAVGVPVTLAGADATGVSRHGACFATSVPGELLLGGRKLAGSAQWRDATAWLQHGSILITDDQGLLAPATRGSVPAVSAAATLGALPSPPAAAAFARAFADAWARQQQVDVTWVASEDLLAPSDIARFRDRYTDPAWIWQR